MFIDEPSTDAPEPCSAAGADGLRRRVRESYLADEAELIRARIAQTGLSSAERLRISEDAAELVEAVRREKSPRFIEAFLAEYGLSSREGIALLCLAEALLRVPDDLTADELIADKLAAGDWRKRRGATGSSLVRLARWGLAAAGGFVDGGAAAFDPAARRIANPAARRAVRFFARRTIAALGDRFVYGRTIPEAFRRARKLEAKGYTHSYDMLGEGARTDADAARLFGMYMDLARALPSQARGADWRANPGISVKLSAIHPRYEFAQRAAAVPELAEKLVALCRAAADANVGISVDAEEADRLDISLDIFEAVAMAPALKGWDGFGVVVQAYGRRSMPAIDWIYDLAGRARKRLALRLVKGAYWDTEIKRAQVLGLDGFPVFTRKAHTDVSYLACARRLLGMTDRILPQFGTHNAHTLTALLRIAGPDADFEFQRIHGMGEALHELNRARRGRPCRVYAPIGEHRDLLAYLVRRLLENGANSSFVHQIADPTVPPTTVARDPIGEAERNLPDAHNPRIAAPARIFGPERRNARGWDIAEPLTVAALEEARAPFERRRWRAAPDVDGRGPARLVRNPARPEDVVGEVVDATPEAAAAAVGRALEGFGRWSATPAEARADALERTAELYERHAPELMAIAAREAGKNWLDCVGEIREAVDFCRYYANEARRHARAGRSEGRGVFACISPWNFPLAIFTGQALGPLAAGNAVVAKPAGQTCLIAARAVALMREAGVPEDAFVFLPGRGSVVGSALMADPRIAGACFTGSTEVARLIDRSMSERADPAAPFVAETGGLNAMIVDSTALPEQAVRDIVVSAFQSAGQRCSALRILYVQKDVERELLEMLTGAMDALRVGDPWLLSTDVGPTIDEHAMREIADYVAEQKRRGRLVHEAAAPESGWFVAPTLLRADGIESVEREVFGPVLHVATFEASDLDPLVDRINARGFGLTLAVHTRVDPRHGLVAARARIGNVYVNRNQIGAVVGSQPFGGEALSGTGPKAGGPHYLSAFLARPRFAGPAAGADREFAPARPETIRDAVARVAARADKAADPDQLRERIRALFTQLNGQAPAAAVEALDDAAGIAAAETELPGPTGERNFLKLHPRGTFLCLGDIRRADPPGSWSSLLQAIPALALGGAAVVLTQRADAVNRAATAAGLPLAAVAGGPPAPDDIGRIDGLAGVCAVGDTAALRAIRVALARREDQFTPLIVDRRAPARFAHERTVCIDTTAAGGNATLMGEAAAA